MSGVSVGGGVNTTTSRDFPRVIMQSAIPFIFPSSGSIGNNGALTLTTALPHATAFNGGCWMYFPANAIAAGVGAGWYWVKMSSSTTVGTIYNSVYTSGTNFIGSDTAFATTGPGAYTQTTSATADIAGPVIPVPGGTMGPNGTLELSCQVVVPNNANAKPFAVRESGSNISTTTGLASVGGNKYWYTIQNKNNQSLQVAQTGVGALAAGAGSLYTTRDTSAQTLWGWAMEIATATDYIIIDRYEVRVTYGA